MIFYFIKFFEKEAYADAFIAGSLYLNPLSYFKREEDRISDAGRYDATEAVAMWWQPHDVVMTLDIPGIAHTEISEKDLAAPISVSYNRHNSLNLFCLYAVYLKGLDCVDGKFQASPEEADELQRQLVLDERCLDFGKFAVIFPAGPFLKQLREALTAQGYKAAARLVDYYDEDSFHGQIPDKDIPFRKQKRFGYQREYRLCVWPLVAHDSAITIHIGDLSRICLKMPSSRLPRRLMDFREDRASTATILSPAQTP